MGYVERVAAGVLQEEQIVGGEEEGEGFGVGDFERGGGGGAAGEGEYHGDEC